MCIWLHQLLCSLLMNKKIHTWTQEKLHTQTLFPLGQPRFSFLHSESPWSPSPVWIFPWLNGTEMVTFLLKSWWADSDLHNHLLIRPSQECGPTLITTQSSKPLSLLCRCFLYMSKMSLCLFASNFKLRESREKVSHLFNVYLKDLQKHLKNSFNNA